MKTGAYLLYISMLLCLPSGILGQSQGLHLLEQGKALILGRNYQEAWAGFQQAREWANDFNDEELQLNALNASIALAWLLEDFEKAQTLEHTYESLLRKSGKWKWELAFSLKRQARLHRLAGDRLSSFQFYQESLSLYEEIGDQPQQQSLLAEMIAQFSNKKKTPAAWNALHDTLIQKALVLADQMGNRNGMETYKLVLSRKRFFDESFASARDLAESVLAQSDLPLCSWLKGGALRMLARILLEMEAPKQEGLAVYHQLKDSGVPCITSEELASSYNMAVMTYGVNGSRRKLDLKAARDQLIDTHPSAPLVLFYLFAGYVKEARELMEALLTEEVKWEPWSKWQLSGYVEKEAGNPEGAQLAFQRYLSLRYIGELPFESRFRESYGDILRDEQLLLLEKDAEINELKLQRGKMQKLSLLIVVSLLAALAGLLFYYYRNKRKNVEILQAKNALIAKALSEKELLLREIHHRVKNNLQVISSLLGLQSRFISDATALDALNKGRNRVESMALIHRNLYQLEDIKHISVDQYIQELCETLFSSYNISDDQINLRTEVEAIQLDVDIMIPLGLVLNELITNTLKHAFPNGRKGELAISLRAQQNGLQLEVKDDGVGFSPQPDIDYQNSFGFRLVKTFAQKLQGEICFPATKEGTAVQLVIPAAALR